MKAEEGRRWNTEEHATRVEYQRLLPDLVLVSTFRG
jgi:catechol O-methyltransferase